MIKYFLFSIFSILLIFISATFIGGFDFFTFVDIISLGLILIIPFFLILTQYKIKEITLIIKNIFSEKLDDSRKINSCILFLNSINKNIMFTGITGFLYGIIGIFSLDFENLNNFLKGLSASLIVIFYSLIVIGFLINPLIGRLKKKLVDFL